MADYDLAIIGGGINGAAIARDAAGRGVRVVLFEQSDLASGTSSASTKLIHGGLRYLEHGALRMVRGALAEREVLLKNAPHIIRPMRFVLPAVPGPRSPQMLRFGLFLYDWLGRRRILPGTQTVDLTHNPAGHPLMRRFIMGYEYSDCWVDDSRLVVLNAIDAAERGATIRTRTRVARAEREDTWRLILNIQGRRDVVTARVLINAAGPWAGVVSETVVRTEGKPPLRLVKGSHIVVPKAFDHDRGYIFQNTDGRIVFALPFHDDFTLIGTTDDNFTGALDAVAPSAEARMCCKWDDLSVANTTVASCGLSLSQSFSSISSFGLVRSMSSRVYWPGLAPRMSSTDMKRTSKLPANCRARSSVAGVPCRITVN